MKRSDLSQEWFPRGGFVPLLGPDPLVENHCPLGTPLRHDAHNRNRRNWWLTLGHEESSPGLWTRKKTQI